MAFVPLATLANLRPLATSGYAIVCAPNVANGLALSVGHMVGLDALGCALMLILTQSLCGGRTPRLTGCLKKRPQDGETMKIVAVALFCTLALPAQAASITVDRTHSPPVVFIDGDLEQKDSYAFTALTEGMEKALVKLRSVGGRIYPALQIGNEIRRRGFDTSVIGYCNSACALIWAGGSNKHLPQNAKLGFHQPREDDGKVSTSGIAVVASYMARLGYSDAAIRFALAAPPNSMKWVGTAERGMMGVNKTGYFNPSPRLVKEIKVLSVRKADEIRTEAAKQVFQQPVPTVTISHPIAKPELAPWPAQ
jgi:hypothetical protein